MLKRKWRQYSQKHRLGAAHGTNLSRTLKASGRLFCVPVRPGWPKVLWFVAESKHLSKPPRDWFPHIKDANQDTAYIEVTRTLPQHVRTLRVTQTSPHVWLPSLLPARFYLSALIPSWSNLPNVLLDDEQLPGEASA